MLCLVSFVSSSDESSYIQDVLEQLHLLETQGLFSLDCTVHCLNDLLGTKEFTNKELNKICYSVYDDLIHPQKHIFGGQFGINLVMVTL